MEILKNGAFLTFILFVALITALAKNVHQTGPDSFSLTLRLLADKKRQTVIVQFETLEALRKSVLTKAAGRLKKRPELVVEIEELVKKVKAEAQTEIDELNKQVQGKARRSVKDLLGGAKSSKSKASKKKDRKKKKKKDEKDKKKKRKSSSGSDSTSTPSDDSDSDQEEKEEKVKEKKGSDDESESGSTHRTLSAPTEVLGEKPKKRRTIPPESAGSQSQQRVDDADLWSNSKFTPETERSKQSETITDELMEMISDVLYDNFKGSSESQFSSESSIL